MFIHEAVAIAMTNNTMIFRAVWGSGCCIKPTNDKDCCVCYVDGFGSCPRWQPFADDLLANDWEVTTKEST